MISNPYCIFNSVQWECALIVLLLLTELALMSILYILRLKKNPTKTFAQLAEIGPFLKADQ